MSTLSPVRRRIAAVSAPLLLALSLTACGGDDASGAPEDASTEDFCGAFTEMISGFGTEDSDEVIEAANAAGERFSEIGTPEDFSDEARNGFEAYVGFLNDVDEGDVDDLENAENADEVFGDDSADVETFINDATTACPDAFGGLGDQLEDELGELEDELPSEEPS